MYKNIDNIKLKIESGLNMNERSANGKKLNKVKSRRKGKATINDVANLAGVVPSTVSHVINGTATITPETTQKVMAAIEKLNYSPNALARALRQKETGLIGVVLQDISSEFYAKCAASILEEARKDNYVVLLCDASFNNENVREGVEALVERRVDGLIFIGGGDDESIIQRAIFANVPVVLGDRQMGGLPSVEYDNAASVKKMVCALYETGYRRFAYVGEPVSVQSNLASRYRGYIDGLYSCGIGEEDSLVILDERLHRFKLESAYELFEEHFGAMEKKAVPEVILTSNDMIAQGIMSAAKRMGFQVPGDIAVVGFDDISISKYFEPALTTIVQDEKMLGKTCYQTLMSIVKDKSKVVHEVLPQKIKIRQSAVIRPEILAKYQDDVFKEK